MKAVTYRRYGSPDVLRIEDVERPEPGPDDVLVRVQASSLNAADLEYLHGTPFVARMGSGLLRPRRSVLGFDAAGVVAKAGARATRFRVGDRVFADLFNHGFGALAEYVCAPEDAFAPIPPSLSFEEAATLPHSGILAIQGLLRGEQIESGDRVLINGAGGCVGPFAIQMAKAYGAVVTAVDRRDKLEFLRSLGADHVIDFEQEDYARSGKAYDWILDLAAYRALRDSRRALAGSGRYIMAGGPMGRFLLLLAVGSLLTRGSDRVMGILMWQPFSPADVDALIALVASGAVRPIIDCTHTLDEAPEAFHYLESGRAQGKIVIAVDSEIAVSSR